MKNIYLIKKVAFLLLMGITPAVFGQQISTFEDFQLSAGSYWNGMENSFGQYTTIKEDSIFKFENHFSRADWGYGLTKSWSGIAYSRMADDTTAGFTNQHSAVTAAGAHGSTNYAVYNIQGKDTIWLTRVSKLDSMFITNGTYPYLSMKDGDMFAKKFGGETGNEKDWFLLTIRGLKEGEPTDTIEFYLADYRFADNNNDYIVDEWTKVDLSVLDSVDMLEFSLSSSDTGDWGMNTPAYFCLDDLSGADFEDFTYISGDYWNGEPASYGNYPSSFIDGIAIFPNEYSVNDYGFGVFESWSGWAYSSMQDSTTPGFTNQYSAYPAEGAKGSSTYSLCYNSRGKDTIFLNAMTTIAGTYITNGTYGVHGMQDGDMFTEKFGGETGDEPDWFLLTIKGINEGEHTNTIEFYLADYRFDDNGKDYIVKDWEWVDLSGLGLVDMIEFSLSSSDTGAYGMNTPAYFFIDNFNDEITAINSLTANASFKVYPNPFVSSLRVESEADIQLVRVIDLRGQILLLNHGQEKTKSMEVKLDNLERGIYFIEVRDSKGSSVKRIVKQR